MTVVVVTKVGGRPDELRSCLDSVVRSSYRNIEILVLIGAASRSIAAVLRSYARWDPRIRILNEPTGSSPKPGSALPNGHYLMVIEASERLEKRAVATLVKVLRLTESDFAVAIDVQGSNEASLMSADSARLDGMDCLGLTIATCPDHPAADSMSGKLFRQGFLTDLGWTVNAAPTIDQRHLLNRAYRWGRFDLVSYRVVSRQDADVSHIPSPVRSNSHNELSRFLSDPSLRAKSNSQPE